MEFSGLPRFGVRLPPLPVSGFGGPGGGEHMHRRRVIALSVGVLALLVLLMFLRGDAGWKGQETATFPPATDLPRNSTPGLAHPGLP